MNALILTDLCHILIQAHQVVLPVHVEWDPFEQPRDNSLRKESEGLDMTGPPVWDGPNYKAATGKDDAPWASKWVLIFGEYTLWAG